MTESDRKRAYSPKFVGRVFEVVRQVSESAEGKTLAELAQAIDAPKSSILNIIKPMAEQGLLISEGARYRVGPGLFDIGYRIAGLRQSPLTLRDILEKTARASGESVYISVLDREARCMRFIQGHESVHAVRYVAKIGESRPMHCGSGALALLAHEPPEWVEAFLRNGPLPKTTPRTVTDPDRILTTLAEIRETGVAVSLGESALSGAGVAAPILGVDGKVAAALVIAAPVDRLEASLPELKRLVRAAAQEAEGLV